MSGHLRKLLCECDALKHYNSHKKGSYTAYLSGKFLVLKCKTCNKKKIFIGLEEEKL